MQAVGKSSRQTSSARAASQQHDVRDVGGSTRILQARVLALQRAAGNRAVASLAAQLPRTPILARCAGVCTCGGACARQESVIDDEERAADALRSAMSARRSYGRGPGHEGETIDGSDDEVDTIEAEYPVDFVGPLQPGDTRAVPHDFVGPLQPGVTRSASFHPLMTVVTPGTATSDCGDYTYKVQWGIPASEAASSGWIVQKVNKTVEVTDCDGNAVTPSAADDPAGYPFWEGWEFTPGQHVWVGPASAASPHSGDTFGGSGYGPGTKGKKTITGEIKAIVGFTMPAGMAPRNIAPAWALPYTRTEPPQFASTLPGAAHTLTSEWNCCPTGTVTKRTTVTTNP
jgi:hypothetical protein